MYAGSANKYSHIYIYTRTHLHMYISIYVYIYICICAVNISIYTSVMSSEFTIQTCHDLKNRKLVESAILRKGIFSGCSLNPYGSIIRQTWKDPHHVMADPSNKYR